MLYCHKLLERLRNRIFPVYECHCIVPIWANNSYVCSRDTRECCYVVKASLRFMEIEWK